MLVVFLKELRDSLRDRRTVLTALFFGPVFGPVLFVLLVGLVSMREVEKAEAMLSFPVVGAERAPNLVEFLRQQGAAVLDAPADPEQAILDEQFDVILRIAPDFAEAWEAGEPAPLELLADRSRREVGTTLARVQNLLQRYGAQTGQLRLRLRGVDPMLSQPLLIRQVDLSTPESRGAMVMAMLPYFLMMGLFVSGMSVAIDTTAGERGRRSLEPLLTTPVPRWQLVGGKLLTTTSFALMSLILSLLAFTVGIRFLPAAELDVTLNLDASLALLAWLVTAPVALVAAGLLTVLASFAKSFREAQSYMGVVVFVPMLPTLWLFISPEQPALWMMGVPLLSQSVFLLELISGRGLPAGWLLLSAASSLLVGFLLAALAAILYGRPRHL